MCNQTCRAVRVSFYFLCFSWPVYRLHFLVEHNQPSPPPPFHENVHSVQIQAGCYASTINPTKSNTLNTALFSEPGSRPVSSSRFLFHSSFFLSLSHLKKPLSSAIIGYCCCSMPFTAICAQPFLSDSDSSIINLCALVYPDTDFVSSCEDEQHSLDRHLLLRSHRLIS